MHSPRFTFVAAAVSVSVAALVVGCNRNGGTSQPAVAAKQEKPGPEESFKRIMEEFRRKVEDVPIGFVVTGANTRSSMVGTNKVSYQLIPPSEDEKRYKATVTIVSQIQYSYHRSKPTGDENEKDQNAGNQNQSTLNEKKDNTSIAILDPTLAGKATRPPSDTNGGTPDKKDTPEEVVASRPDQQVRKYELIYENGRWALATKPDPKNEKSIQFAFDQALSTQG